MIVKLLTEHHLEFLSLTGGCSGSSKSTHVKMPHCWKSHATAHAMCASLNYRHYNSSIQIDKMLVVWKLTLKYMSTVFL